MINYSIQKVNKWKMRFIVEQPKKKNSQNLIYHYLQILDFVFLSLYYKSPIKSHEIHNI